MALFLLTNAPLGFDPQETVMLETQASDHRRVLLVEDNAGVAELVMASCRAEGFDIDWKQSADASLGRALDPGLDMILLDRGLPDGDGVDLLRDLRTIGIRTPVILISASVGLGDRILGLEAGADDYLPKPFAPAELVARCQAVWRRGKSFNELPLQAGNLTLRLDTLDVAVNGRPIVLSAHQIRLLIALLQHQGRPCPRAHLRSVCTTPGQKSAPNSLEASICRLRAALQEAGASVSIGTARGIGYILRSTTKAMQDNLCETFKSSGQSANVSVE
jgi:DNA-binding response OmpR family regulator